MEANCFKLLTRLSALCLLCGRQNSEDTDQPRIWPATSEPATANPSEWLWARGKPSECRSNGFYCPTLSGCCNVGSGSAPGCLCLWLPCRLCTRPPHCWSPSESNQGGVNLLPLASRRWRFCLTSSGSWSVCTPAPVQTRRFSLAICLCAAKADVKASRKVLSGQQKAGRVCC